MYDLYRSVRTIIRKWEIETQARDCEGVTTVMTSEIKLMIAYFSELDNAAHEDA